MILRDIHDGWSFSLHIDRFQIENRPDLDLMDCEWLMVRLQVTSPDTFWTWVDPCLMFSEAKALAAWLADIAARNPVRSHIGYFRSRGDRSEDPLVVEDAHIMFLEPEISFGLVGRRDETVMLKVCLYDSGAPFDPLRRQSFRHVWTTTGRSITVPPDPEHGVGVVCRNFTVTTEDLLEASRSLLADLLRLPPREGLSIDDTDAQPHG